MGAARHTHTHTHTRAKALTYAVGRVSQDEDGNIVTGCEELLRTAAVADPEAFVNAGGITCAAHGATLTGQLSAERCTAPGVAVAEALEAGTRTAAGQLALVADETGVDAVSRLASAGAWSEAADEEGVAPTFRPPVAHLRPVLRVLDRLAARPEGLEFMRTNGEVLGRLTACLQRLQAAHHRKLLLSLVRLIGKVVGGACDVGPAARSLWDAVWRVVVLVAACALRLSASVRCWFPRATRCVGDVCRVGCVLGAEQRAWVTWC